MGLAASFVMYLMIGAGVAAAAVIRGGPGRAMQAVRALAACFFWPLFLPALLAQPVDREFPDRERAPEPPDDDLAAAISRVEAELEQALRSLDGWAEMTLATERTRLDELRLAWRAQAQRIRELTTVLDEIARENPDAQGGVPQAACERVRLSELARRENIERLQQLRERMHDDLLGTLAWVRELVTMIHLAKYTGAPASRAEELIAQIAAAVEGLTEVAEWREETTVPA